MKRSFFPLKFFFLSKKKINWFKKPVMTSFQCFEVVFKDHQWQRKINSKFIKNISTTNTWSAIVTGYNGKPTTKQLESSASSLFHSINVLVTGKSIVEKPHNRINFQDMQLVSLRAVFVSILIFVRSGAGVRRDQSRHLVFMKTIRQSGKLTRDRNQFSRDVNGRSTNESYICRFFFAYYKEANLSVKVKSKRFCTC